MEPLVPWLLMALAGLIVACAVMYSRLQQVESTAMARQSLVADELKDAEEALLSALERVRRMDRDLAERESRLLDPESAAAPPATEFAGSQRPGARAAGGSVVGSQLLVGEQDRQPTTNNRQPTTAFNAVRREEVPSGVPLADWRARAADLALSGLTPRQIAQELSVPVGEVELILALQN